MKEEIITEKSGKAIGPYSQAIKFGSLVFVSGQIGKDPKSDNLAEGLINQTKQIFENLKNLLKEAGSDINNVLKTTVYLTDMNDFPAMNEVYSKYFKKPYPARATLQAAKLPKGALIEIECVAFTKYESDDNCCGGGCC